MADLYCPFCESHKFHFNEEEGRYECDECGWLFDEAEIEWQETRHCISHYLIDTDEEHPIVFEPNNEAIIGEYWPDTFGLSTLEMFHCDRIFQIPGDGTIWFHIDGEYDENDPTGLKWHDLEERDFLDIHDLYEILRSLEDREADLAR